MPKPPALFTTDQAAAKTGKSERRVREIALELGLGVLVNPRCRLLTAADVRAIKDRADGRCNGTERG